MNNEQKYLGQWWLPEKPDDIVEGELICYQDYIYELQLIGYFGEVDDPFSGKMKQYSTINGFTTCGKKINLFNCSCSNFNISMPGMITAKYSIQQIVIGNHYSCLDNIQFRSISISYDNLENWLWPDTFEIKHYNTPDKKVEVHYCIPETQIFNYGDYELKFQYSSNVSGDLINRVEVSQIAWVKLSSSQFFTIQKVYDLIREFKNLLSIACMRHISIRMLKGKDIDNNEIEIRFRKIENHYKDESRTINQHDLLFSIKGINNFNEFINVWREKHELLEPIIQYFVDAHKKDVYTSISFLKMVQAVEAFSRRARKNWVVEQEEHNKRVESILESISNETNKEWLINMLKYTNEPSLKTRLKELFKETNFMLNLKNDTIKNTIYKIVETRNYYTHFDDSQKSNILNPHQMFYVGQYLFHMLRALILLEFGFSEAYIIENISKEGSLSVIKENMGW